MPEKIVLAYSGGLDTSVAAHWLRTQRDYEVHCLTIDLGNLGDTEGIRERGKQAGAVEVDIIDAKDDFLRYFVFPALQAGVVYEGRYPLATALGRPLIAKLLVDKARQVGATAVAHGCTGKGNDQVRLDVGVQTLAPDLAIVGTTREHSVSRDEALAYAAEHGITVRQTKEHSYSTDENLWGRSIEGGRLEDPGYAPPEEIFQWTASLEAAPSDPQVVEIEFEGGNPVAIDGVGFGPSAVIRKANEIAGRHGVGRIDIMEDRMIGLKVRENYECPGATLLLAAHKALEALVTTHAERAFKALVDQQWADMAYKGLWWEPFMEDLNAFTGSVQRRVTGKVRLRLFKSSQQVIGRESPYALYSEAAASFDDENVLEQSQMTGMVRIHGMESILYKRLGLNG